MALTKLTTDLDNVQGLDDEPNDVGGLTAAEVKVIFDEAGNAIKTYINDTLTEEIDVLPATSISVSAIVSLAGLEVQTVLESIKGRLDVIAVTNASAELEATHIGADLREYDNLAERLDTIDVLDVAQALQADLDTTDANIVALTAALSALDLGVYKKTDWTSGTNWNKMPNGEIHQWGSVTTPSTYDTYAAGIYYNRTNFNFPIRFPTSCNMIWGINNNKVSNDITAVGGMTVSGGTAAGQMLLTSSIVADLYAKTVYWFAIGN